MERGNSGLGWVLSLCPTTIMLLFSRTLVFTAVHWVATLNVGSGGAHASYYHRANEQVRLPMLSPTPQVSHELLPALRPPQALLFFLSILRIRSLHAFILLIPCQDSCSLC